MLIIPYSFLLKKKEKKINIFLLFISNRFIEKMLIYLFRFKNYKINCTLYNERLVRYIIYI